jgi:hypothetical protein
MEDFLIELIPTDVEETTRQLREAGIVDRALGTINHPDYVHHTGVPFGLTDCQAWVMYSPRIANMPETVTLAILTKDEVLHTFQAMRRWRWDGRAFRQLGEELLDDSQLAVITELAEDWKRADPEKEWANFPPYVEHGGLEFPDAASFHNYCAAMLRRLPSS